MYSGYYCKKCKIIPLIKSNITDNKDIKYMVKCKFHINYFTLEEINKKYYTNNIEKKYIINEKLIDEIENDDSFLLKTKEILSKLKSNNKQLSIIKNDIINFLNKKMKEIEYLYDKAIKINDNLEKLILIVINSYETLNTNYSNIKNIKYLMDIEFIDINDKIYPLIDEIKFNKSIEKSINLIDRILPIQNEEFEDIYELSESGCKELKMYNNKLLFILKDDSICIYPINDLNSYVEIILPSIVKFDIDKHNNIVCLFPDYIKIFSEVSYEQIKDLKKEDNKINNNQILDAKPVLIIKTEMKCDNNDNIIFGMIMVIMKIINL